MTPQELLDKLGIQYQSKTNRLQMKCFWHNDRNPSSGFYLDTQRFFCFSCEITLDMAGFYAKYREISRNEALRELGLEEQVDRGYDRVRLQRFNLIGERLLGERKWVGRLKHAALAEIKDKIEWAYERHLLNNLQFDLAIARWYQKIYDFDVEDSGIQAILL